ncbi:MAG: recombinase family protein [bacterium]
MSKRIIGYVRVSTEEQAKNGLSLKSQESTIKTYAKLKKLCPVEILEDKGASGNSLEREGMQRLISLCEQGEVSHLIVYKMDRLTRRTRDLLEIVEDVFVANGVCFHSVTENVDTTGPLGKFFLTLMGALAQMERELIVERIKDALKEKKRRGEPLGSPALGFRAENKERIENCQELEIVQYVKALRRKRLSHRDIAKRLNKEGIPTKRGGRWYGSTVSYILKNHRYKGQN